jgi:2,3-bisphosphoglycerate-dependent phosphoglycerate mutase
MRLILVRHGETDSNKASLALGRDDLDLNETGRWQAQRLAEALQCQSIVAVYSSPLRRALATARAIAERHHLSVELDEGLIEMDIGEMEGLTFQQVRERYPQFLQVWLGGRAAYEPMPGGERLLDVQERAWQALERICAAWSQETVAVVTHNFVLLTILCRVLGLELADFRRLRHNVAAVSVLQVQDGRMTVLGLNDTCHLEARE